MSATVYKDVDFQGVYAQLYPGLYSGRDLVGCPHLSTNCEDLDNAISSIRLDPNVIVAFADSHALSASGGGGARVLVGPAEVPDLAALGMSGRISSIRTVPYRAYDSATPPPGGGATIYDSYGMTGRRAALRRGDYTPGRLTSEEVKFPGPNVMSVSVDPGVIVILYAGANFEIVSDAIMAVGPTRIEDLDRVGMGGRVRSIRVLYGDPFDVPGRARLGPSAYGLGPSVYGLGPTNQLSSSLNGTAGGDAAGPGGGDAVGPGGGVAVGPRDRGTSKSSYWIVLILIIVVILALVICCMVKIRKVSNDLTKISPHPICSLSQS